MKEKVTIIATYGLNENEKHVIWMIFQKNLATQSRMLKTN